MFIEIAVALVVFLVTLVLVLYVIGKPPPPKICGSPGGPPVVSPRFKLRDGRYLSYVLRGVPVEKAKHKIIIGHGFHESKDMILPYSREVIEELGVCFILYDRPGYGESDPNPKRTPKTDALDVGELLDHLKIDRVNFFGLSMAAYVGWALLMYLPHRVSAVNFIVPFFSYYWPGFPSDLINKSFKRLPKQDQWSLRIAHYAPPWLFNWFMTQKYFPVFKTGVNEDMFTKRDMDMFKKFDQDPEYPKVVARAKQQGEFYCSYMDLLTAFGKWEYGPLEVKNPFPNNEGKVNMWLGSEDRIVALAMNRYVAEMKPWIKFHEIPGKGHMFFHYPEYCETFLREVLSS